MRTWFNFRRLIFNFQSKSNNTTNFGNYKPIYKSFNPFMTEANNIELRRERVKYKMKYRKIIFNLINATIYVFSKKFRLLYEKVLLSRLSSIEFF